MKKRGRRKRSPRRLFLIGIIAIISVAVVIAVINPFKAPSEPQVDGEGLKAAIIDGLGQEYPNEEFINEATNHLNNANYTVDLYNGSMVTKDLYEKLPKLGYEIIILRVHSAPLMEKADNGSWVPRSDGAIGLFTTELYREDKYQFEQLFGTIVRAKILTGETEYFAIPPEFIERETDGSFDETTIIIMSCYGFLGPKTPQTFIDKGASIYVGWEKEVTPLYMDRAALYFIQRLLEGKTMEEAVDETMEEIGPDPQFQSKLRYYPLDKGDYVIHQS